MPANFAAAGPRFSVRSGRINAIGRAVLALTLCVSLLAAHEPHRALDRLVELLLLGYAVYALALLAASRSRIFVYRLLGVPQVAIAIDFVFFTTVLYLSEGASSPYFSPFVFLILAATLHWGARGALAIGVLTVLVFVPAGWAAAFGPQPDPQGAQMFILRTGYVLVISVLLATFAGHIERMVDELSRLSHPVSEDGESGPPIAACLKHALAVFRARSGAFVWSDEDEPYTSVTLMKDGRLETRRLDPSGEDWLVDPAFEAQVFLFDRASRRTFARQEGATVAAGAAPLSQALLDALSFERALVIPAATAGLKGWVLVCDHEEPANEDLAVGAMVAAQINVLLDRWETQSARREAAAAETRLRLARDLHDGVLQFLAGAGLRLDTLAAAKDLPPAARDGLTALRQAINDEQRELRGFITTLRPPRGREPDAAQPLAEVLEELAGRLSRHWNVEVVSETAAEVRATPRLAYDIGRIVREAVANAVRHGKARTVRLTAGQDAQGLTITIRDDGCGFPFEGARDDETLARAGEGPRSLHERVRALAGRLRLESTSKGATLIVDLPPPEAA
jgi:signal transduction histidine kinase